jgi:beta-phosphoglucomutase-like phosphatase (HAD superfamily)
MSHNAFVHNDVPLKVVFVDWDGTLSHSRFWEQWQYAPGYHQAYRAIQQHLFLDQPNVIRSWMRGMHSTENIVQIVAKITSLSPHFVLKELITSCQSMQLIDPALAPLVQSLRRQGIRVVIATDNMDTFLRWTAPALNLQQLFDGILCSHPLGTLKNDSLRPQPLPHN